MLFDLGESNSLGRVSEDLLDQVIGVWIVREHGEIVVEVSDPLLGLSFVILGKERSSAVEHLKEDYANAPNVHFLIVEDLVASGRLQHFIGVEVESAYSWKGLQLWV